MHFLRFCGVGLVGFLVDTGVLLALVDLAHVPPILAKALSFAIAVLATFELNRIWAFRGRYTGRWRDSFLQYLGVQGVGFVCNWVVFTAWISLAPRPLDQVIVAAIVASGCALLLNFVGADRLVFRIAPRKAGGDASGH